MRLVYLKSITGLVVMATVVSLLAAQAGADFKPLKTRLFRGGDAAETLSVDIAGAKDVYLVVTLGPDNYDSDQAIWAEPTFVCGDGCRVDATTLKPASVQVGWGKLYADRNQHGRPLMIGATTYKKGFWAHGPSVLHFQTDGKYSRFEAKVGIDVGAGKRGSVEFIVTNIAPKMPKKFKGTRTPAVALKALPADKSPHTLNPQAAKALLDQGVETLVFIRRFTLNANHVYTEYLNSRWTPGGGLCVLDLKTGAVCDLVPQFTVGVVNRFDISYDAKKILFDYKKGPRDGYRIYEVGVDGRGLRQVTFPEANEAELVSKYGSGSYHHGTDDMHPCYLPDGGIAFVTTRCQYGILCNASDQYTTKNLYRMDGSGKNMRALSNSPVSEASPAMLPDGRLMYHRWEYVDKAAGNLKCIWSMNPDGTGSAEVYGNVITFPETMIYPRPIPGAKGKVVMLGTSHCCPNNAMGAVIVIDTAKDIRATKTMQFVTSDIHALAHTGFHFKGDDGKWKFDKTGTKGRLFKDPYPLSESLFIATRKPKGPAWDDPKAYGLCLLDAKGVETALYTDEGISCWHPYPVKPRVKPPVLVTSRDEALAKKGQALCVVTDVYTGMEDVKRGTVKYLRVLEETPRPWAVRKRWDGDRDGMAHSAIGQGFLGLKAQYGVVPVETDGSAQFYVPAERNIYFQALDANYLAVQTERTYVQYMPGERRACIGCHETPNMTSPPMTGTPLAMLRPPSRPGPQRGQTDAKRLFDYDRQIQPILDKHCTKCHGGAKPKAKLVLTGESKGVYSVSYGNLISLGNGKKQVLGNRRLRNENVGSAGIEYMPPYALGALTSPLAAMLSRGRITLKDSTHQVYAAKLAKQHKDIRLSDTEFMNLTNWLDVNCPFHPSYWGRLNAQYAGHPNYRPNITFEEALMRRVPQSIADTEAKAKTTKPASK